MQKLQKSATKPIGTKHFAGAVILSLMLSIAPIPVVAGESGGGLGYGEAGGATPSAPIPDDLKRFYQTADEEKTELAVFKLFLTAIFPSSE